MKTLVRPLQTARLQLHALCLDDAPALFELFHDAEAMPYWHTLPHQTVEDTRAAIEAMLRPQRACWWTVRTDASQETIGFVGFLGFGTIPGFGYAIHAVHRSRGYAIEAARAALDFGFRQLDLDRVELWIHEANMSSRRVAESLGFAQRGCFRQIYPRERQSRETLVYGSTRSQWLDRNASENDRVPIHQDSVPLFYGVEPVLEVADVASAVEFYREQLGFTVEFVFGDPVSHAGVFRGEWSTQGLRLQLTQREQASGAPSGSLYLLVAPRLDTLYEEYRRKNVPIVKELALWPWGRREFTIRDPDGHLLRFGEPA
ncbi:GNAT family N-acetyltransferase [Cupriavidus sp. YAF13]|uniref:GNAT family N-acetyltransferase n=1 Tax=Cupriavidus sp. YAF13 TaxID=3233075 RepID=UPI003F9358C1